MIVNRQYLIIELVVSSPREVLRFFCFVFLLVGRFELCTNKHTKLLNELENCDIVC